LAAYYRDPRIRSRGRLTGAGDGNPATTGDRTLPAGPLAEPKRPISPPFYPSGYADSAAFKRFAFYGTDNIGFTFADEFNA
jgi:hypothetical protein